VSSFTLDFRRSSGPKHSKIRRNPTIFVMKCFVHSLWESLVLFAKAVFPVLGYAGIVKSREFGQGMEAQAVLGTNSYEDSSKYDEKSNGDPQLVDRARQTQVLEHNEGSGSDSSRERRDFQRDSRGGCNLENTRARGVKEESKSAS
jgi:hypothetical protein